MWFFSSYWNGGRIFYVPAWGFSWKERRGGVGRLLRIPWWGECFLFLFEKGWSHVLWYWKWLNKVGCCDVENISCFYLIGLISCVVVFGMGFIFVIWKCFLFVFDRLDFMCSDMGNVYGFFWIDWLMFGMRGGVYSLYLSKITYMFRMWRMCKERGGCVKCFVVLLGPHALLLFLY